MKTTLEYEKIEEFLCLIPSFPKSIDIPFFDEDKEKLFMDLHRKELKEICGINKEDTTSDDNILKKLTEIVKELLSKNTNLDDTFKKYLAIEQEIESSSLGNQYIYEKQRALSVKALYYHKIKNFNKAIVFTLECIALIEYLLQQGMYTLSTRCFEQNKNISRVYFKSNQIELGNKTAKSLMCYLFNGEHKEGLFGSVFKNNFYWTKNPDAREYFAYDTFISIAEDMVRSNLNNHLDFFPNEWNIDLNFEIDNPNRQIIRNWISVNEHLKNLNYEEYFDSLTYFFQQSYNKHYDILKISLLIDLTKLIIKLDFENKEFMTEKINDFFNHKILSNRNLCNFWISNQPLYNRARFLF
ncbi:hypothetical protein [Flavobacterium sp. SLB02]|uniref:hypothetical protein n=1 Tax=Flavobacterium sp. SLB02 TaxID=2665645 RepID=UPI0012A934B4|nr:hypothetical protein [Flavobacterium sp. SLB02]QGK75418.1 hypothetical protein GIY83_15460 [Flavobacterium sp. SLB02]